MDDKKKPGAYTGYTEARKAANARYEANTVERVSVVLPKGKKAVIASAAASQGQSVNAYINQAIDERMDRDATQKPVEGADGGRGTPIPSGAETPSRDAQSGAKEEKQE